MVTITSGWATDVGRVRSVNEDSLIARNRVFAVADGMGGHAAGDVASAMAIAGLAALDDTTPLTPDDVLRCIGAINRQVLAEAEPSSDRRGMGTTLAGLALVNVAGVDHWCVFNVGDSRVYRFADGGLTPLSVDHSAVAEMVAAGEISAEEARTHPQRSVVTRSIGTDPAPTPDVWVLPTTPGERFVVCSDGLSSEVADRAIADALARHDAPGECAATLVGLALAAGGRDNVSVVVVDVDWPTGADDVDEETTPRHQLVEGGPVR